MTDAMTWVDFAYLIVIAGLAWRCDYLARALRIEQQAVQEFEQIAERLSMEEAHRWSK